MKSSKMHKSKKKSLKKLYGIMSNMSYLHLLKTSRSSTKECVKTNVFHVAKKLIHIAMT